MKQWNHRQASTVGEEILKGLNECTVIDKSGWTVESIERVMNKLYDAIETGWGFDKKFQLTVFWAQKINAFTTPCNHIFVSRRLLERCSTDDMIAFVLAHEIAHHQLGHFDSYKNLNHSSSVSFSPKVLVAAKIRYFERLFFGPRQECDADLRALEFCAAAGYDSEDCLMLLKMLEQHFVDLRLLRLAYGLDCDDDSELSKEAPLSVRIRTKVWTHSVGYLPAQDRIAEARRQFSQSRVL